MGPGIHDNVRVVDAVRQRFVASLRRELTVRHVLGAFAIVLVASAGAWVGLLLGANRTDTVGPLVIDSRVTVSLSGDTVIDVPPLGSISLDTHDGPLALRAEVASLDADVTQQALSGVAPSADLDEVQSQVRTLLWRIYLQALACSVLGAALAVLVVWRRPKWAAVTAGVTAGVMLLSAGGAAATWNDRALAQPKYSGLLVFVPRVVGDADAIVDNLEAYGDQLGRLVENVSLLATAARNLPTLEGAPGTVRALFVSDIHLNPNVWPIMRSIIDQYDVDLVLDTGDIADQGTALENSLLTQIETLDVPYVYIRGNHDSTTTSAAIEAMDNTIVLDDEITDVAGLSIAGIGDPRFTPDRSTDVDDSSVLEAGEELATLIESSDEPVDVAMVHDPLSAEPLAGLTPLVLAGHRHEREDVELGDSTRLLVQGSSGGAGLRALENEEPTPLTLTLLYFDRETQQLTARDEFTLGGLGVASAEVERIVEERSPQ